MLNRRDFIKRSCVLSGATVVVADPREENMTCKYPPGLQPSENEQIFIDGVCDTAWNLGHFSLGVRKVNSRRGIEFLEIYNTVTDVPLARVPHGIDDFDHAGADFDLDKEMVDMRIAPFLFD